MVLSYAFRSPSLSADDISTDVHTGVKTLNPSGYFSKYFGPWLVLVCRTISCFSFSQFSISSASPAMSTPSYRRSVSGYLSASPLWFMYLSMSPWRFSPVGAAPHYIHSIAEKVVWQNLIQLIGLLVVKDCFYSGGGICVV